ncbi:tyrosine-type recombinase/integrase [Cephaloticoccus primus]|nr:tyrosine-type recombinase/integrase [Cephaloticoccus primus]
MAQDAGNGLAVWEYPKKSGIRIRPIFNRSAGAAFSISYRVEVPARVTGRGRLFKQFKRREDAEAWADRALRGQRLEGEGFFELTDAERGEVAVNMPLLRERGISLTEAVQFVLERMRPRELRKPVAEVVEELVASKEQRFERGDLREASYRDFSYRTRKFAASMGERLADEVTGADIKGWLNALKRGPRTNANYLAVIGEVFRYAVQKKYVLSSPLDELTDVERKELCGTGDPKEPSILTVDEAQRLLNAALASPELGMLGVVVLALFCGLRTEEIKRLEWEDVRMSEESPVVMVGAKIAKKRRIRHVEIPPVALAWLSLVPNRTGEVTRNEHGNDYQRRFLKLHNRAGFAKWEANAMRHSFGSYHYALHGNPLETSRLLGHKASDEVLFSHYRALVTKEQAERYFAISPPKTAGNVLQFCA